MTKLNDQCAVALSSVADRDMNDSADGRSAGKRVLVLTAGSFPSKIQPVHGVFVKERVRFVAQLPGIDLRVLSPTPYFPPIRWFRRWYPWSQIPYEETVDGLQVRRPRYVLLPKIGGYVHSELIYSAARREIERMRPSFDFDIIDSHFAYPSGVAAVELGKRYGKPVVITGRGEDIACHPDRPIIGKRIRSALRNATQLIAVSDEIAGRMEKLGADPRRITVIPNGVDCNKFFFAPQKQAREKLDLPLNRRIVLAVGYRLELKGFHLLIDAIPAIKQRIPDVLVVIVGGQARWASDYLPVINERIKANDVADNVLLTGSRPQEELPWWYNAADILSILSSREGSPNVLMESLACGLPAVATPVGGIPSILENEELGMLYDERSARAASAGIITAFQRGWDRQAIRRFAESRSWTKTAQQVDEVFERAIREYAHRHPK